MTVEKALETVEGAEIMALNVPGSELQAAVRTLMGAAQRALRYDEMLESGKMVSVIRCKDCAHEDMFDCPLGYIEHHTLQFVNHDPDFYCRKGAPIPL